MKSCITGALLLVFTLTSVASSADILGCPNGIPKGTLWPRLNYKVTKMTEKYDWATGKMVDIGTSGDNSVRAKEQAETDVRIGYGATAALDVAVQAKYRAVESESQKKTAGARRISFSEASLAELWLAGKYRFIDLTGTGLKSVDYFKLSAGAAYGFGLADNLEDIITGLGPGCDKAQLGLLAHGGLSVGVDFAAHLIYEWWGKAPEYAATAYLPADEPLEKNHYNFGQSGRDMPDRLDYMFVLEKGITERIELKAQLAGWLGLQKNRGSLYSAAYRDAGYYAYMHNIVAGLEFYPMGEDYDKRKFGVQVSLPYSAKNSTAPDYSLTLMSMWTF